MNIRIALASILMMTHQAQVWSAETTAVVTPTASVVKMLMGLAVVLAVLALVSWVVKRMVPSASPHSAIKVVGGTSVGSRERVVVLEVAGRWLVVGVAQGQVNAIANLEAGAENIPQDAIHDDASAPVNDEAIAHAAFANPMVKPFSAWLKKSVQNIKTKG